MRFTRKKLRSFVTYEPLEKIGVVLNHAKKAIKGKLDNRGQHCMMLGYADNHAKDVYCMLNLETNRVLLTRDIIWLKKMNGAWKTSDIDNTSYDESINDKARRETDNPPVDGTTERGRQTIPPPTTLVSPRILAAGLIQKLRAPSAKLQENARILTGNSNNPETDE
jgi:hypothetical protein